MPDPVMMAIATAVAGKATESLTDQASKTVAAIVRLIREKFRGRPDNLPVLDAADDDRTRIEELAALLGRASTEDPAFGSELRALWTQMGMATGDGVVNVFHGHADKVVQLRDVQGNLNID
jgi:hypothetical protein